MDLSKDPARLLHTAPSARGLAKAVKILLMIYAGLLFVGLYAHLSIYRLAANRKESIAGKTLPGSIGMNRKRQKSPGFCEKPRA